MKHVAASISVFSSALCFHSNVPKLVNELRYPKASKFRAKVAKMFRIGVGSAAVCCLLYYIVGLFSYFAFGKEIAGNLLTNFQQKGYWYLSIVKLAYALVVLFSNPVIAFPSLLTLDHMLFTGERTFSRRIIESLVWCTIVWFIAIMIPQLDIVFGFTGSTGGVLLVYILPSLYYIAVVKRLKKRMDQSTLSLIGPRWLRPAAYILIAISIVIGVISTISNILLFQG